MYFGCRSNIVLSLGKLYDFLFSSKCMPNPDDTRLRHPISSTKLKILLPVFLPQIQTEMTTEACMSLLLFDAICGAVIFVFHVNARKPSRKDGAV